MLEQNFFSLSIEADLYFDIRKIWFLKLRAWFTCDNKTVNTYNIPSLLISLYKSLSDRLIHWLVIPVFFRKSCFCWYITSDKTLKRHLTYIQNNFSMSRFFFFFFFFFLDGVGVFFFFFFFFFFGRGWSCLS